MFVGGIYTRRFESRRCGGASRGFESRGANRSVSISARVHMARLKRESKLTEMPHISLDDDEVLAPQPVLAHPRRKKVTLLSVCLAVCNQAQASMENSKRVRTTAYLGVPHSSSSTRLNSAMQRVAISQNTHKRLKNLAVKKFRGVGSVSKLGTIVLDKYLGHMERVYFGRAGALCCSAIPAEQRDYDAVLFDMDGVLCDSEMASRNAAVSVFRRFYNVNVQAEDFAPFTGTGEANFLAGVANVYQVAGFDPEVAKQQFFEVYRTQGYVDELEMFAGVDGLVTRVKQLGLKVAVASSADRVKVDANLSAIGLPPDGFDFVTCGDDIERKKPAPDVFLAAARGVGVAPRRCVVVEDAAAGVQAAKSAGMRCVAVSTSLPPAALTAAGADVVRGEPSLIAIADLLGAVPL